MAAFRTPRRVALSGYPLMNSVDEYYHMLAWACPEFFPDKAQFDLLYKEPIEAGRRVDATERVRKRMARQSQILQDLVRPILHRVGPEELGRSLPPKLEAVIAVRMPPHMVALYEATVAQVQPPPARHPGHRPAVMRGPLSVATLAMLGLPRVCGVNAACCARGMRARWFGRVRLTVAASPLAGVP